MMLNQIMESKKGYRISVLFYMQDTKQIDLNVMDIPNWLFEFILTNKINLDCYSLDSSIAQLYPLSYTWSFDINKSNNIIFEVKRKDIKGFASTIPWGKCKLNCSYVWNELNHPELLGGFI